MAHNYNRAAFQTGTNGPSPLLALYCSLVDLELALKDHFAAAGWRKGHSIIDWIAELGEAALGVQLSTRMAVLQCTDRDGNVGIVQGNLYPEIRYLRHETDFLGMSTDAQLGAALQLVGDVKAALRAKGVTV